MNPIKWLIQWNERRRVRDALLAMPGVDLLVRRVMDKRYGAHHWRVRAGVLEAEVRTEGQGDVWWGPIGPLRDANTRAWLRNGAPLSHAKPPIYSPPAALLKPLENDGFMPPAYVDTTPLNPNQGERK